MRSEAHEVADTLAKAAEAADTGRWEKVEPEPPADEQWETPGRMSAILSHTEGAWWIVGRADADDLDAAARIARRLATG